MASSINASSSGAGGIVTAGDASGVLQLQTSGVTGLTIDASQKVSFTNPIQGGSITSGTAVASTSGTSIDFTGIPAWVKRITVMFNEVSTNSTSFKLVQLGAGSVATSGYLSASSTVSASVATTSSATGNVINANGVADVMSGHMVFTLISGNTWISSHAVKGQAGYCSFGGGSVTLGGTLDRVRITTVNGTDTFDAGSINILYEG